MNKLQNHGPKIGLVANSIDAFSDEGKDVVEGQMRKFFESLKKDGSISKDSIFCSERVCTPFDAEKPWMFWSLRRLTLWLY